MWLYLPQCAVDSHQDTTAMGQVPALLALLLTATPYVHAQTACSVRQDAACVAEMRSLYTNTSAYWFGTRFATDCPPGRGGVLCRNTRPSGTSLITRLLGDSASDPSGLTFVINVTYPITLPADGTDRTYTGCGRIVDVPLAGPQYLSIDPLSGTEYPPFDVRELPEVTWPAEDNALYTVIMYDAGFCFTHGLYVNVAGGRLQGGDTIVPHFGPGNPVDRANPYVWLVFKQQRSLDVATVNNLYTTLSSRNQSSVFVDDFISPLGLSMQSYGINVVMAATDEYASFRLRSRGLRNGCPFFYGKWLSSYIQERGGLPSLPVRLGLTVSIDVTFTAPAITYTSCDIVYQRSPVNVTVDYRSRDLLGAVETRMSPEVSLVPEEISVVTLRDKQYTLLMYDPTPELGKTEQDAYVHWMVVNIRGTDITSGDVVYEWLLPMAPVLNQLYLFALFEQTTSISTTTAGSFGSTDCRPATRCKFRAGDFIRYNNLSLVGLRYFRTIPDTYRQYMAYAVKKIQTKQQACWGQASERPQCPFSSGMKQTNPIGIIISVLTILATYLTSWIN
ncbi:uncharacterized protein C56G2.4-like [Haliotis rufescens]|uniref:uncharacterized protein C56G2.4-like n=1 Tax=Haliotis rufescens TaxID=6454 RepID=UPI00201F16E6|nr:uncharacterized protein C56G2.4-like [Haliotis rufescens]